MNQDQTTDRDPVDRALDLLMRAHDLLEDAGTDPRTAAVRHACRMGMAAAVSEPLPAPELASHGVPGERTQIWVLRFEDADVPDAVFDAAALGATRAELAAREAYATASGTWNCTLMRIAALDPADDERQRARADALEAEVAALRADSAPTTASDVVEPSTRRDPDDGLGEALATFVPALRRAHRKHLETILRDQRNHLRSAKNMRALAADRSERESETDQDRLDTQNLVRWDEEKTLRFERDVALAERVDAAWKDDPGSLLLPLGSIVRVRNGDEQDGAWPIPVTGSTGIVIGYSDLRSRPNQVGFIGETTMTSYDPMKGDIESPFRCNYLPEELEILGHGTIMDTDVIVDWPGWMPTHGHGRRSSILYTESMVVRSDGGLWRIQPCCDVPELTQSTTDDAEGRRTFAHLKALDVVAAAAGGTKDGVTA